MTRIADLGTLSTTDLKARVRPKYDIPTRLEEKGAKDQATDKAWRACCRAVDKRDGDICQCCGCKTVRSLELSPNRGEHAHIVRRRKASALMHDKRNVFKSCATCHQKYDRHQLRIEQNKRHRFEFAGVSYVNADQPMRFVK